MFKNVNIKLLGSLLIRGLEEFARSHTAVMRIYNPSILKRCNICRNRVKEPGRMLRKVLIHVIILVWEKKVDESEHSQIHKTIKDCDLTLLLAQIS